ncbi:MAG TPA: signal peptidase I [Anaeromyxobacteraceae bacterium]|nr:signal peptidase I [Anaeromyxobacteraceae bacterium]
MSAVSEDPGARREKALRYASATRHFLERRWGRRVPEDVRGEATAAATELESAVATLSWDRAAVAVARLDAVWEEYLTPAARKGALREIAEPALVALLVALVLRTLIAEPFKIPSGSMFPSLIVGDHVLVSKISYGLKLPFSHRWAVRWASPRRGDVIVFENPREKGGAYVRRVVGVQGDVVELRDEVLYVNRVPQPRQPLWEEAYTGEGEASSESSAEHCLVFRETLTTGTSRTRAKDLAPPSSALEVARGSGAHLVAECHRPRPGEWEGPFERVAPGNVFVLGDNRDHSSDSRSGWQVPLANIAGKAELVWWSWGRSGAAHWPLGAGPRFERLFKRIE